MYLTIIVTINSRKHQSRCLKKHIESLHILYLKYIDPHTLFFHCGSDAFYYRKKEVLKMQVKIRVEIPYPKF